MTLLGRPPRLIHRLNGCQYLHHSHHKWEFSIHGHPFVPLLLSACTKNSVRERNFHFSDGRSQLPCLLSLRDWDILKVQLFVLTAGQFIPIWNVYQITNQIGKGFEWFECTRRARKQSHWCSFVPVVPVLTLLCSGNKQIAGPCTSMHGSM